MGNPLLGNLSSHHVGWARIVQAVIVGPPPSRVSDAMLILLYIMYIIGTEARVPANARPRQLSRDSHHVV